MLGTDKYLEPSYRQLDRPSLAFRCPDPLFGGDVSRIQWLTGGDRRSMLARQQSAAVAPVWPTPPPIVHIPTQGMPT
jgi:hypothetical protein